MLNNKHMHQVHEVWAWAFDGIRNDEVKHLVISNYIRELYYSDPISAEELGIFMFMYQPRQSVFGDQLEIPIDYEQTQTRI